ncbi:MAG: hypothetical protein ACO3TX_10040, partial [Pseudomonadales bacterium]
ALILVLKSSYLAAANNPSGSSDSAQRLSGHSTLTLSIKPDRRTKIELIFVARPHWPKVALLAIEGNES